MTPRQTGINRVRLVACCLACLAASCLGQDTSEKASSAEAIRQYRVAVALQNKAIYDLATEEWQSFLQDHANDPLAAAAHHYLGVCLFQQGKFAAAEAAFQRSIDMHVAGDLLPTTLLSLGLAQFNLGRQEPQALRRSVASLQRLLKEFGSTAEAEEGSYYLAEALAGTDQTQQAIDRYRRTLDKYPQHAARDKLLYGMATALQAAGSTAEATQTFQTLVRDKPDSSLAYESSIRLGELLATDGQTEAAISLLTSAARQQKKPLADYATLRLADALLQEKAFARSASTYAHLIERFPQSSYRPAALLGAGSASYLAGDLRQARKWLELASQEEAEPSLSVIHWLARVELADGHAAAALSLLTPAIDRAERSPFQPQLRLDQADALYELPPRRGEALQAYARLANSPEDHLWRPQAAYMAAFTALELKDYVQARSFALAFEERFPDHPLQADVSVILAEAELQTGNLDHAAKIWQTLLEDHPNDARHDDWINRYAICLNRAEKHQQVVDWLLPRWQQLPSAAAKAEALFLLGGARLHLGDKEESVRLLRQSLQLDPQGPQSKRRAALAERSTDRRYRDSDRSDRSADPSQ